MKDWKGRKDSPLMDLPVEVLDRIFCVRPELKVRLLEYKQWIYMMEETDI